MKRLPKQIRIRGKLYRLAEEAPPYEEIQKMLDGNQFLKGMKAGPDTVHSAGKYYLIADPAGMEHIRDRHVDESNVGSKFNKNMDPLKASIALMSKYEPEVEGGWKFKWIGKDTGQAVGVDNVKQGKPEDVAKMQDYKTSPNETIKITQGKGEPTTAMSLVTGKVGELPDGKIVLSVMTAFPGKNGAHVANRNDLAKEGFYFVVPDINKYKQASVKALPKYIKVKGRVYIKADLKHVQQPKQPEYNIEDQIIELVGNRNVRIKPPGTKAIYTLSIELLQNLLDHKDEIEEQLRMIPLREPKHGSVKNLPKYVAVKQ